MKLKDLLKTLNEGIYVIIYKINDSSNKELFKGMAYEVGSLCEDDLICDIVPTGIYQMKIYIK